MKKQETHSLETGIEVNEVNMFMVVMSKEAAEVLYSLLRNKQGVGLIAPIDPDNLNISIADFMKECVLDPIDEAEQDDEK